MRLKNAVGSDPQFFFVEMQVDCVPIEFGLRLHCIEGHHPDFLFCARHRWNRFVSVDWVFFLSKTRDSSLIRKNLFLKLMGWKSTYNLFLTQEMQLSFGNHNM